MKETTPGIFPFFFNFYFYFILLYNTVLVLPYIDMNPPQAYMHSQTFFLFCKFPVDSIIICIQYGVIPIEVYSHHHTVDHHTELYTTEAT